MFNSSTSVSKMLARKISNLGMFCGTAHQSTDKNEQKGEYTFLDTFHVFKMDTLSAHVDTNVLCFMVTVKDAESFEKCYAVEGMLGSGGFGTVYAGTRRRDNKPVSFSSILQIFTTFLYLNHTNFD